MPLPLSLKFLSSSLLAFCPNIQHCTLSELVLPSYKKPQDNYQVYFVHVPVQDTTAIPC